MSDDVLTLPDTARALRISLVEALQLIEQRKLPAARGRDGAVYVRLHDVEAYRQAASV